jgi:translation initiation factor 4E
MTEGEGTPLQSSYSFSFMRRGKGVNSAAAAAAAASGTATEKKDAPPHPYENAIKVIATVSTVEGFWEAYNWMKRPADLPTTATTDYHFFRAGIKPTWEDASNAKGGKWIVRLPKGLSSRYWEEVILALIGGQLGLPDGEVCGAVLSVRYSEDILGVWNKTATDREVIDRLRDSIRRCLQLPASANMEYKPHQNSIQDRTSFRNTNVWKPKSLEGRSSSMGEPGASTSANPATGSTHRRPSAWEERKPRRSTTAESSSNGRWRN